MIKVTSQSRFKLNQHNVSYHFFIFNIVAMLLCAFTCLSVHVTWVMRRWTVSVALKTVTWAVYCAPALQAQTFPQVDAEWCLNIYIYIYTRQAQNLLYFSESEDHCFDLDFYYLFTFPLLCWAAAGWLFWFLLMSWKVLKCDTLFTSLY